MKNKILLSLSFLLLLNSVIFLISCTSVPENSLSADKQCSTDHECVQATCCHAKEAVNIEKAPDCAGILCSMECQPETLDCGQGEVKCLEGKCQVVLNN